MHILLLVSLLVMAPIVVIVLLVFFLGFVLTAVWHVIGFVV
jgi:hypothetical protein